jgi:hypothetical protein
MSQAQKQLSSEVDDHRHGKAINFLLDSKFLFSLSHQVEGVGTKDFHGNVAQLTVNLTEGFDSREAWYIVFS